MLEVLSLIPGPVELDTVANDSPLVIRFGIIRDYNEDLIFFWQNLNNCDVKKLDRIHITTTCNITIVSNMLVI